MKCLTSVILVSYLGIMQTSCSLSEPSKIETYSVESNNPKQTKSLLPKYNLENLVAEFNTYSDLEIPIENESIKFGTEYLIRAYNSILKPHKISKLTNSKKIEEFLKGNNFDVIELYEWIGNSDKLHDKPSAIIYKSLGITRIMFDLEGSDNLADGITDSVRLIEYWSPDLILKTGEEILKKRVNNVWKKA